MDDYRLLKIVGKGSFGVVYKAIDTQNSREVALKMIDMASGDDDLTDVMLEVTAMCEMESPFIIKYYCSFAH
ncbi:MAG: Serine/threonine-protein kinase 24, partial [Paramarteilia canceri]